MDAAGAPMDAALRRDEATLITAKTPIQNYQIAIHKNG